MLLFKFVPAIRIDIESTLVFLHFRFSQASFGVIIIYVVLCCVVMFFFLSSFVGSCCLLRIDDAVAADVDAAISGLKTMAIVENRYKNECFRIKCEREEQKKAEEIYGHIRL